MPVIISNLDVDVSLLSEFESHQLLDASIIEDILVCPFQIFLFL